MASLTRQSRTALCQTCRILFNNQSRDNSNKTSVCRINRHDFPRLYPTTVVQPDGSTITIRYKEPRKIIKLPLDLSTLSEAEMKARLLKRKPKQKIVIEDDLDDDFDSNKYSHLWKK